AEDGQGVIIASGSADAALVPSRTTSATAVLSPVMGDPPDMTAPPDMTTPPDMTAPPTCGEPPAPGGRTQFYVDAHYTGAETGEPLCPYTSITAAIAHADLS